MDDEVVCRFRGNNTVMAKENGLYGCIAEASCFSSDSMYSILRNDDSNRALMGANMQRQAVP